jgi:hypothetical protein
MGSHATCSGAWAISSNAEIPPEFSRPEGVAILKEYYAGLKVKG